MSNESNEIESDNKEIKLSGSWGDFIKYKGEEYGIKRASLFHSNDKHDYILNECAIKEIAFYEAYKESQYIMKYNGFHIDNKGIIKIYMEAGDIDLYKFIYIHKGNYFPTNTNFKITNWKKIFNPVFALLHILHDNQCIHGDIKSLNMIIKNDQIYLIDFGAIIIGCDNIYGASLVTESYTAPERFYGIYGPSNDVWALGLVLYEFAYGFHPFYKCKSVNDLEKYFETHDSVYHPKQLVNTIPTELYNLINDMLNIDNQKRITMEQVIKRLDINVFSDGPKHTIVERCNKVKYIAQLKQHFESVINNNKFFTFRDGKANIDKPFSIHIIDAVINSIYDEYNGRIIFWDNKSHREIIRLLKLTKCSFWCYLE